MNNALAFLSISPGPAELLLIFGALLMLFGAKNVPKIARNIAQLLERVRRVTREVSDEIMHPELDHDSKQVTSPDEFPPTVTPEDAIQREPDDRT